MATQGKSDHFKLENLYDVKDKVAVVTGGGSGIGLMVTQALAVNGAKVYIIGRSDEKLRTVAETYGKEISGEIIPIQGDVTSKDEIARLYKEIAGREECVCILVNNAGIVETKAQTEAKSAEEMAQNLFHNKDSTFENWMDVHRTNVAQIFFMTTAFLPLLQKATERQQGFSGCVINIASISGIIKTFQNHAAYNSSKAAANHLTKMLASEIAGNGLKIRVNAIAPGVFPSEMTTNESDDAQKSHIPKEDFEGEVPAARPGKDQDFGNAVLFMATNQYLNGQVVPVDGGYILQHGAA